jgi:hypothetical protein
MAMSTTIEPHVDTNAAAWLVRVRAEYREMPGLSLTQPQMRRLWGFQPQTCEAVVDVLVTSHVLRRTPNGSYVAYED